MGGRSSRETKEFLACEWAGIAIFMLQAAPDEQVDASKDLE